MRKRWVTHVSVKGVVWSCSVFEFILNIMQILSLISESRRNIQIDGLSLTVGIPKSYQRQPTWLISPDKSRAVIKNKNCCYFQAKVVWAARSSWPSRSWHGTTSASSVPFARSPWWARASYRLGQRLTGSTNWDFYLNDRKTWNLLSQNYMTSFTGLHVRGRPISTSTLRGGGPKIVRFCGQTV